MNEDALIRAAAVLYRANRRDWEQFIVALTDHTNHIRDECVRCAPEVVLSTQGRAKHAVELLNLLKSCNDLAMKLDQRSNK